MSEYKNPVCRGSFALGTACGKCERCIENPISDLVVKDTEEFILVPKSSVESLKSHLSASEARVKELEKDLEIVRDSHHRQGGLNTRLSEQLSACEGALGFYADFQNQTDPAYDHSESGDLIGYFDESDFSECDWKSHTDVVSKDMHYGKRARAYFSAKEKKNG